MPYFETGLSKYPLIPGHEWTGIVEEIGSSVTLFKAGDRVRVTSNLKRSWPDTYRVMRAGGSDATVDLLDATGLFYLDELEHAPATTVIDRPAEDRWNVAGRPTFSEARTWGWAQVPRPNELTAAHCVRCLRNCGSASTVMNRRDAEECCAAEHIK